MTKESVKKPRRHRLVAFFPPFLLFVVIFLFLWLLPFFRQHGPGLYVFPGNPKQGDTIFIKAISDSAPSASDFLGRKINFLRKGDSSEWVSFLGIDAILKPGKYKILANVPSAGTIEKEIEVIPADFSSYTMIIPQELKDRGFTAGKVAENIAKKDNPSLGKVLSKITEEPYFKKPFSFPLRKMQKSGFVFGQLIKTGKYNMRHFGVDLRANEGTRVFAANDGKVVFAGELSNYGKTLVIDHGLAIFSLYLHLSEFKVSLDDMVKRGQVIALSGNSGYSTSPHLHFSIREAGARVDPVLFIETTRKSESGFNLASIAEALLNLFNVNY